MSYNKRNNRVGYVFRNRYYSQMITNEAQLYNCISYIHYNPLKAGIVKKLSEYKYSSYSEFLQKKDLITPEGISLVFGSSKNYLEIFNEIHKPKDIEDIKDIVEEYQTPIKIINEYLTESSKTLEEIKTDHKKLGELLFRLRHLAGLSLRDMEPIFKINKDRLNKIINSMLH